MGIHPTLKLESEVKKQVGSFPLSIKTFKEPPRAYQHKRDFSVLAQWVLSALANSVELSWLPLRYILRPWHVLRQRSSAWLGTVDLGSLAVISLLGPLSQSTTNTVAERTEICCLTVLEAGSLKLRCEEGWSHLRAMGGNVFHISLLASAGLLAIFDAHGLQIRYHADLCLYIHLAFFLSVSQCLNFPFLYRISHIEGGHTFTPSMLLDHWQRHYLQIRSQTQVHGGSVLTSFEGT